MVGKGRGESDDTSFPQHTFERDKENIEGKRLLWRLHRGDLVMESEGEDKRKREKRRKKENSTA